MSSMHLPRSITMANFEAQTVSLVLDLHPFGGSSRASQRQQSPKPSQVSASSAEEGVRVVAEAWQNGLHIRSPMVAPDTG